MSKEISTPHLGIEPAITRARAAVAAMPPRMPYPEAIEHLRLAARLWNEAARAMTEVADHLEKQLPPRMRALSARSGGAK
jgi:hypothetical protein